MADQAHRAIDAAKGQIIDDVAKGRDVFVLAGIQDDDQAVAAFLKGFRDIDLNGEITGDIRTEIGSVQIKMELEHRPFETQDMDRELIFEVEELLIGEKALVVLFVEVVDRLDLDGVRKIDDLLLLRQGF